jgi:HEAT repeat protein/ATP/ADP translocase
MRNRESHSPELRHNLLQWEQPVLFLQRIFRVYPNEVKLLLWVTLIQLVMRVSSILVNNYAQTAFLKRFGVGYLPTIFMVEAILTFFFTSIVGLFMDRFRTLRVFTGLLLFFAMTMLAIRVMVPLNLLLIYPALYILRSQAVEVLPILYWDILSDLFTTQQSKRLFSLITAGGIFGTTLGSLMTGTVARWVGVDNVLLVFVGGMLFTVLLNENTERVIGSPIEPRKDGKKTKAKGSFRDNLKEVYAFSKQSLLFKYMVLIIAIPNIVLPILTYQFNVVVDLTYSTEQATLHFFGIFRGISNAVMFGILLFSGRFITHLGVPTSLLIHPVNYLIALLGLLFRFDIISAVYARFSVDTVKTALNLPARAVLYNFFPSHVRGLVRVFLRGTVVRLSDLTGSGLLMLIKPLISANLLSLLAAPLVLIWTILSFSLKKKYPSMLIQTLTDGQIDWKRLEDTEFKALLGDHGAIRTLQRGLGDENPEIATLCGELLTQIAPAGSAKLLIEALPGRPPPCQKALLDLLEKADAPEIMEKLLQTAREAPPETLVHLIPTLARLDAQASLPIMYEMAEHPYQEVRYQALTGLCLSKDTDAIATFRERIQQLLEADSGDSQTAVKALGKTGDPAFTDVLLQWAAREDPEMRALGLCGLGKMKHDEALRMALVAVKESDQQVRRAALSVLTAFLDETPLELWIRLLGDEDAEVRQEAARAVRLQGEAVVPELLRALGSSHYILRDQIISLLAETNVPAVEISQFVHRELERAYRNLTAANALQADDRGRAMWLLRTHLLEKNSGSLDIILRVLAFSEFEESARVILKAVRSANRKELDNAIELLETSLHPGIRKLLIPLLMDIPIEEKLKVGQKKFALGFASPLSPKSVLLNLLENDDDPVSQALALYAWEETVRETLAHETLREKLQSENPLVRDAANRLLPSEKVDLTPGMDLPSSIGLIDKVLFIRKVPLFANLRLLDLTALAGITKLRHFGAGGVVVNEGDPGHEFFLILQGRLAVIKGLGTQREKFLENVMEEAFFGEMALIDRKPRSASVVAESEVDLLVMMGADFYKIMEENPTIAINICRELGQRIRNLQNLLQAASVG